MLLPLLRIVSLSQMMMNPSEERYIYSFLKHATVNVYSRHSHIHDHFLIFDFYNYRI